MGAGVRPCGRAALGWSYDQTKRTSLLTPTSRCPKLHICASEIPSALNSGIRPQVPDSSCRRKSQHVSATLNLPVEGEWLATPSLLAPDAQKKLESFDGIWAAPGSPYKSFDGMLKGIEFARRRDWPFLGTCGGFQYALIECVRNVLGIKDADTAENNSGSKNIVIYPVACCSGSRQRCAQTIRLDPGNPPAPGSYLQSFYSQDTVTEEFFCNSK